MSEIGYRYGFNSGENFIRAFKSEHGVVPGEYRKMKNSLKLYERPEFEKPPFCLIPEIVSLPQKTLVVYESDEDYPPRFWNKYNCRKLSKKLSGGRVCMDYGVSLWRGRVDYYIGIEEELAQGDLSGTLKMVLPGGFYAVFTTPGTSQHNFVNTIHRTWDYINREWPGLSGYERQQPPEYETYVEDSRSFSEKIYIPVKERTVAK